MSTAIVFDMDGVLADTEPLKLRAHRAALRARGGELGADLYRREMGKEHGEVVRSFLRAAGLETGDDAVRAYEESFREAYRRLLSDDLAPTEGAPGVLRACRDRGRRLALVTSSERWMADIVLERLAADEAFEAVITADDVGREKPHPEPYRRALEALGPGVESAVAVEDTRSGVASARRAGLPVVAVRHSLNRAEAFPGVSAVVGSLSPPEAFLELVDRVASGGAPERG